MQAATALSEARNGGAAESLRRQGTQRTIVARVVMTIIAIAAGVMLVLIVEPGGGRRPDGEVSSTRETLGILCSVVGLVLILGTLVWLVRSGRFRSGWRQSVFALDGRQRREIRRQIRGRRPVVAEQLPVARAQARETIRQAPSLLMLPGLTLTTSGPALSSGLPFQWFFAALVGVLAVVGVADGIRNARQAREFLAARPDRDTTP